LASTRAARAATPRARRRSLPATRTRRAARGCAPSRRGEDACAAPRGHLLPFMGRHRRHHPAPPARAP
jgi:hypothetical protein